MYRTLVDVETLYAHLGNPDWAVVDCRFHLDDTEAGRNAYLAAHIPGAVYAHLDEDLAAPPTPNGGRHPLPDLDGFRAKVGAWGISNQTQVVVYDSLGGAYAARLWWMLRYLGHERVAVLDGGWRAWEKAGYPTRSGIEARPAAQFAGTPNPAMVASLEEVEEIVARGEGRRLVDSRDPKRYRGEYEPIDLRAGHIPGALNRFLGNNLNRDQRFRPSDALRADFEEILGERDPAQAIVYCGSGVTACQNLLAMSVAGLEGARLFIPSWSGWSSNPARPVETESQP